MQNFCSRCGTTLQQNASFCSQCGAPVSQAQKDVRQSSQNAAQNTPRVPNNADNFHNTGQQHPNQKLSHKNKHDKVMKKSSGGEYTKIVVGAGIIVLIVVLLLNKSSAPTNSTIALQPSLPSSFLQKEPLGASDASVQMVDVSAKTSGNKITIPLDLVKKNRFVSFQYTSGAKTVPLLAYIAPDGKLVTAISLCEPCRSTRFHISGDNIVCNTCRTTWKLQNLEPVSGACGAYPPDPIPSTVAGTAVQIDVKAVANWQPRV
ncbi:MAG: DUF2318 domain-containing protein [Bacteroidota bacterium]|nr:DUF2318 domain-containing protein [Bacteroidota bacterium]